MEKRSFASEGSFIHAASFTLIFFVSSRSTTTVSHPKCICVACEKDYVRRWACKLYSNITNSLSLRSERHKSALKHDVMRCVFMFCGEKKVQGSSAKKEKNGMSMAEKQHRQLEKEVRFTGLITDWFCCVICVIVLIFLD